MTESSCGFLQILSMLTVLTRLLHVQAHALGKHLTVPSIAYSLALLRLPQLYMAVYFVRGVETFSELQISLRRLNAFLSLPEPPAPALLPGLGSPAGQGSACQVNRVHTHSANI